MEKNEFKNFWIIRCKMAKLYLLHITCLYDSIFRENIAVISPVRQTYFERLIVGRVTKAFNFFSKNDDFLSFKKVIDIEKSIYGEIKELFNGKNKVVFVNDNGKYILGIDEKPFILANSENYGMDEIIVYDRVAIH